MKINRKGFTLVELVIVIVIVGILSIISVPIYRGYVEKAIMTEGKVLINAIAKAELAYHVKNDCFLSTARKVSKNSELDINAEGNKYFKEFSAQANGADYGDEGENAMAHSVSRATKYGTSDDYDNSYVEIYVYGSNNGKSWTLRAVQYANGSLVGYGRNGEIVDVNDEQPIIYVS